MPHFLINLSDVKKDVIEIYDSSLLTHLVSSLRIKKGEKIKFIDENGIQYFCKIISADKKNIKAEILEKYESERKSDFEIYLAQGVLKTDAQSLAIANATQIGVKGIYPLLTDNCAVTKKQITNKQEKWQKIADESFKQCERADRAQVFKTTNLREVLNEFKNIVVLAEKNANIKLKDAMKKIDKNEKILVIIGPEGGFSKQEFEFFTEKKYDMISLGALILKAPNAITAGVSNIIYELTR